MSKTSVRMEIKGSRLRMQQVANNGNLRAYFSHLLGQKEPVEFLSPLASEDFKEYRLNELKNKLKLSGIKWGFNDVEWPREQPVWDGIATSADGKTLYLIEAKSHIAEMNTKCKASEKSCVQIEKIVAEGSGFIPHDTNQDLPKWMNGYYQLANRLLFLTMLKEQKHKLPFDNIRLVLLNFVNDTTMSNLMIEENEWCAHYEIILRNVFGTCALALKDFGVDIVCLDVDNGVGGKSQKSKEDLEEEFNEKITDLNTFYSKDVVNCRYVTEDFQWGTDYVAKLFLKGDYVQRFNDILAICRGKGKSYDLRKKHNCDALNSDSNRWEEKIAMQMRKQGYVDGIGDILDYQVPLKDEQSDKAGKIDLLAYDKKKEILRILELKAPDNDNDSLLHCILEGETYKRVLTNTKNVKDPKVFDGLFVYGIEKLKYDFRDIIGSVSNVVACPVIFESQNCRAYREYCNYSEFSNVHQVAQNFRQEVIVVREKDPAVFERVN